MEPVRLAILPLQDAKNLQNELRQQGVELILNHNEQTCKRGCAVTVEVLGYEKDFEIISKTYTASYQKLFADQKVNWEIHNAVFDTSKETGICPACGFEFSTSNAECPDCGLVLA